MRLCLDLELIHDLVNSEDAPSIEYGHLFLPFVESQSF